MNLLHLFRDNSNAKAWLEAQIKKNPIPIYSSFDVRHSKHKIVNVDANIYPAGFNNFHEIDKLKAKDLFKKYLDEKYGSSIHKIAIITEEHTENRFYWDNVFHLKSYLEAAGFVVRLGFARQLDSAFTLTSSAGKSMEIESVEPGSDLIENFKPDLFICNNDFSDPHTEWAGRIKIVSNPPREFGWYQRKKSNYFRHYNQIASELCAAAGVDPFCLRVETTDFCGFKVQEEESLGRLGKAVDEFLDRLRAQYASRGIGEEPFAFVKNNSGTYGLGIVSVKSGKEIVEWTSKTRKKMKAAKGGNEVSDLIIQEGIPSEISQNSWAAEPVMYMVGSKFAGSFFRCHPERSMTESLNSPGANYLPTAVEELSMSDGQWNTYAWTVVLGVLAIAREGQEMSVPKF
jgi:glutamate--cysteine ligase